MSSYTCKGSHRSTQRSLRSGVGGVGGGWCPPTAGMPEACLLPRLLLTDDLAESGAQQLAVGLVRVRPARVSTMGPRQRFTQGAVVGNHPLPASPTSFHSVGEEPGSRQSARRKLSGPFLGTWFSKGEAFGRGSPGPLVGREQSLLGPGLPCAHQIGREVTEDIERVRTRVTVVTSRPALPQTSPGSLPGFSGSYRKGTYLGCRPAARWENPVGKSVFPAYRARNCS
jgi:hypothetical protein